MITIIKPLWVQLVSAIWEILSISYLKCMRNLAYELIIIQGGINDNVP